MAAAKPADHHPQAPTHVTKNSRACDKKLQKDTISGTGRRWQQQQQQRQCRVQQRGCGRWLPRQPALGLGACWRLLTVGHHCSWYDTHSLRAGTYWLVQFQRAAAAAGDSVDVEHTLGVAVVGLQQLVVDASASLPPPLNLVWHNCLDLPGCAMLRVVAFVVAQPQCPSTKSCGPPITAPITL
jgi:hypothetical protein